nr:DUF1254 domain-containing protein [Rhodoplanes serenus]
MFASPGWRTTGTRPASFLVTPPGWTARCLPTRPTLQHRQRSSG